MFKGKTKYLIILLLIAMVILTACGGNQSKPVAEEKPKRTELYFATGGTAGTYYPLGGAIAKVWNENINGLQVTVQPSGGSVENLRLIGNGDADIALAMNNIADDAWNGRGSFNSPIKNFRAVGVVYPEIIQGVALKESGIKSIKDLKGKRVSPGPVGSGTAATVPHILKVYGLKMEDMQVHYDTFGDAVNKMKDGQLDAAWNVLAAPAAAIVDLLTAKEVVFLEITGKEAEQLQKEFPLVSPYVIPAGTYSYKGKDYPEINTVSLQAVLYVREDLDEELVYNLTKLLYEKSDEIAKGHAAGAQIKLDNAIKGITTDFHPGAIKFYKEKGMM
ncbi:TAXI family TRAP transporter solute-binding subunit [Thermovenabulum gondwanense]|uniref:Uncharacterized protein n=1 Tax=Thermovenabulum gondwanense TaxID=520767 RepID=A0A162M6I4_9FIRM|nr:TAXI family TRAP transporter solute-binding subunit [Thermovenabulum gondwanense]KYO64311.1 hypothetical protein ATZ99_20710 [Thermovenabulum gondwanense]